jgi:hypothetical protein
MSGASIPIDAIAHSAIIDFRNISMSLRKRSPTLPLGITLSNSSRSTIWWQSRLKATARGSLLRDLASRATRRKRKRSIAQRRPCGGAKIKTALRK